MTTFRATPNGISANMLKAQLSRAQVANVRIAENEVTVLFDGTEEDSVRIAKMQIVYHVEAVQGAPAGG